MSAATVSLLVALEINSKAIKNAGKYPLTSDERTMLINAGFDFSDIEIINQDIELLDFDD